MQDGTNLKAIATAQSFALCNGQTVVVGTHTYSKPGKYTDVLVANNMCDSTVTTTITLGKAVALAQTKAICSGGSVLVGNHIYTKKGVYKDTLTTKGGCDSVVTTTVTIVKALATSQQFTICSGKSITVGTHTYTKAGTYVDSLKADAGCDSIVTTKVALLPVAMGSQQFTLCEGQTVVVGNHIYSVSGTYKDTLQTKGGCDSILATILKINPSIKAAQKITICEGNRLIIGAHIYSTTGVYKDTLTKGCDSILTTTLTVNAAPKVSLNLNSIDTVCLKGGSVKLSGGLPTGGIYEGQSVTSSVFNPLTAGVGVHVITYSYTNSLGCEGNAKATILVDVCLSIENRSAKQVLNVYPNPHDENFTLEFEVAKSAVFTIKLVNVLGETVKEIENSFLSGVYKNEISTKDLPNGMYFITVQSADMKSVKRVVKN